jgi:hypothetical protein
VALGSIPILKKTKTNKLKKKKTAGAGQIRRIVVQSQPRANSSGDPILKNPSQ